MTSAQKTLIDIASVSQHVVNILDRSIGRKSVESLKLDKIVVGSRTVLEALNKTFLLKEGNADDRLVDWFNSEEPQACLRTLNQMKEMLDRKPEYGVKSFVTASRPTHTQDKHNEAIRLFQMRKSYFHFLLTTGIWNRESAFQQQSQADASCTNHSSLLLVTPARRMNTVEEVDSGKLDVILEWLNAWNSRGTHERTLLLRQPGTCTWLPKTSAYKKWRNKEHSFLWLHGKPGSGKSVLAASVIDGLKDTLPDEEVLVYFYCDFRDERSTSAAEVLRSLLSQLLQQFRRHAINSGDLIDQLMEEKEGGASTLNNVAFLARHASRAAEQFHEPPFFVIDALDECRDVEKLLGALVKLQKGGIRLLTISRPLQVIREGFSGLPFLDMEMMSYEISADIRLHATRELDAHRRLRVIDASLKEEMHSVLCEKAGGMFRWVQCQLDTLKQCVTAVELREALVNLPSDLDATYDRILSEIDRTQKEGKLARRALVWLVVALEPLKLCQIMEGLSIDLVRRTMDRDSGPVHGSALLDALGSLVMFDEVTNIVILSHFSVKEYLIAESTRVQHPTYHVDQQIAHTQIALLCMCYIGVYLRHDQQPRRYVSSLHDSSRSPMPRDDSDWATAHRKKSFSFSEFHPLFEYVLTSGFSHLAYVKLGNKSIFRAMKEFQMNAELYSLRWKQLNEGVVFLRRTRADPKHDLAILILIMSAPAPLLHSFIGTTRLQPKDGTNPLVYAASFRKVEHARTLLSNGADVNSRGWDMLGLYQLLPLEVAIRVGDRAMVDLLLHNGARVPHRLFVDTFMQNSLGFGRILSRLLQIDEFVEWAVEVQDEKLLLRALDQRRYLNLKGCLSEQDINAITRRLIQIGLQPPLRSDEVSIRHAVSRGHILTVKDLLTQNIPFPSDIILDACHARSNPTMIRLFLDAGGNAKVVSPNGDTPLHLVLDSDPSHALRSEDYCLQSIEVLVRAGCNPCARNLAGETPLHVAVRFGNIAVVEYLLSLHVPLPPNILLVKPRCRTATPMLRFLVLKGADVQAIAANGNTPLHIVMEKQLSDQDEYIECAKILVDSGWNPCVLNAYGETALDVAVKMGYLSPVRYLLSMNVPFQPGVLLAAFAWGSPSASIIKILVDHGADVHVRDSFGNTLLHLAMNTRDFNSELQSLDRIKLLIDAGCDPCAYDARGRTPFYHAASRRFVSVMEYLLSLGVPVPPNVMLSQLETTSFPVPQRYFTAIRFLLDKGGDVHTTSEDGDTFLHWAANLEPEHDALEFTQLLVEAGCNPSVLTRNSKHETPLHIAARKGHVSVIDYYLSFGTSLPPDVLVAASTGYSGEKARVIRHLIAKGADATMVTADAIRDQKLQLQRGDDWVNILVNAGCDIQWKTLLRAAARGGRIDNLDQLLSQGVPLPHDILLCSAPPTIHFLLKRGIDVAHIVNADTELLHRALDFFDEKCCLECAKILINSGWDPSLKNTAGEMPIHIAIRKGQLSTVKYLLARNVPFPSDALLAAIPSSGGHSSMVLFLIHEGANVNAVAPNGDTPLHLALRSISWRCVEVLLDYGADPSARNADGQTLFDIAEAKGHFFLENFRRLVRNAAQRVESSS